MAYFQETHYQINPLNSDSFFCLFQDAENDLSGELSCRFDGQVGQEISGTLQGEIGDF